jgi:ammonium transporter, Amt family
VRAYTTSLDLDGSAATARCVAAGGITGLVGAAFVGPRLGRFEDDGKPATIPRHDVSCVCIGTLMLWFGW